MKKQHRSSEKKSPPRGSRRQNLEDTEQKLHAQIGRLEEFIADTPFRERKRKIVTRNIIAPPARQRRNSATKKKRLSRKHQKVARQERHRHLFNFFCLFLLLCAMLYWLFQTVF